MKRDWDLIRQILEQIEASDKPVGNKIAITIPGVDDAVINYHAKLLYEHGLIDAFVIEMLKGTVYIPKGLTWEGHEFIDNASVPGVWERIKSTIAQKGGRLAFDVVRELALNYARQQVFGG